MQLGGLLVALSVCAPVRVAAQINVTNTLADVGGFESATGYPAGNLTAATNGQAVWQPAAAPGQITNLNDGIHGKVLRRLQTGVDNIDTLTFPAATNGVLRIRFDARASTNGARTLDIMLLPASGGTMASMLGWGTVTNELSYYDGTNWIAIRGLDTSWHTIEMVNYLSGSNFNTFDLKVDGAQIGTNLPWRDAFTQGAAFSRLRVGGIRGPVGQFGDVDNLVVLNETTVTAPEQLVLTNAHLTSNDFRFAFQTQTNAEYRVESSPSIFGPTWTPVSILLGDGLTALATNALSNAKQFYRVWKLPPPGYADGYRGIWFTLGQVTAYGDKYSGGLATYTADHVPTAIYSPEVDKTFFVYGGTIKDQRHLLIMASYYDHATQTVPRPTVVMDKNGVNDPHDNASLAIDPQGYLWVFVSGRATARPGFKYRSRKPYDISQFDLVQQLEMTYPQSWYIPGKGFFLLFTKYTNGRELYWETSSNGYDWSADQKLAGIGGHYQVTGTWSNKVASFFNRHPGGDVDKRTDLYYAQTTNMGQTWTTINGTPLTLPLSTTNNPALVIDYASQGRLVYTCDLNFDTNGNPVMLYVTSSNYAPGPQGDPRTWTVTRWDGSKWITSTVCNSDHNYDMGSLFIRPDRWLIIGPTQNGPQLWQTGGEMALWVSCDQGLTWSMERQITHDSIYNHSFARRPVNAKDPFYVYWADGNGTNFSPCRLYFSTADGTLVHQPPYDMPSPTAAPQIIPY